MIASDLQMQKTATPAVPATRCVTTRVVGRISPCVWGCGRAKSEECTLTSSSRTRAWAYGASSSRCLVTTRAGGDPTGNTPFSELRGCSAKATCALSVSSWCEFASEVMPLLSYGGMCGAERGTGTPEPAKPAGHGPDTEPADEDATLFAIWGDGGEPNCRRTWEWSERWR